MWLNFAPSNDDRFVTVQELFSFGHLQVAEPVSTPLFIGGDVEYRDLPTQVWGTQTIPMITEYKTLFGSAGFLPDGSGVWFTSTRSTQPRRYAEQRFDFRIGYYNVIVTEQVGHLCSVPVLESYQPTDPVTCYAPGGEGVPVDAIADETVSASTPPPPGPILGVTMADWHSGVSQAIDPNPPIVIADPSTVPPDPEEPPPGDVEVPSPDGEAADGADDVAPGPVPTPLATTITPRSGRTTTAVLPSSTGVPSSFRIVGSPSAIDVRPTTSSPSDPTATGPDGAVDITPAPGFVGTASFLVAPRTDGGDMVVITVDVAPEPSPIAADDVIEVERGAVVVVDPSTLLGNDRSLARLVLLDEPQTLRIVSVYGFDGGTAVLRLDGKIEVEAVAAGSFSYTVADEEGATGSARVVVQLTQAPTSTPTTAPSTTAAPSTTPPVTTPATWTTAPAVTPTAPVGATPSSPEGVTLPETGANVTLRLWLAATLVFFGVTLVVVVRRRGPATRRG